MSIEKREEFDHREINTVLDHKSNDNALLKLIKRNTCHKTIKRISCKWSPAITEMLSKIFTDYTDVRAYFKTITSDNGS